MEKLSKDHFILIACHAVYQITSDLCHKQTSFRSIWLAKAYSSQEAVQLCKSSHFMGIILQSISRREKKFSVCWSQHIYLTWDIFHCVTVTFEACGAIYLSVQSQILPTVHSTRCCSINKCNGTAWRMRLCLDWKKVTVWPWSSWTSVTRNGCEVQEKMSFPFLVSKNF